MKSLSDPEKRRGYWTVATLCVLRNAGDHTEDQIAHKVEFESAEAMYQQLRNWGLPDWLVGGDRPREPAAATGRKARAGGGKHVELPTAANAVPLFRKALRRLLGEVDRLSRRREYLQDGRFVVAEEYDAPTETSGEDKFFAPVHRGDTPPGMWREFCEKRGHDPSAEVVFEPVTFDMFPKEASSVPPKPLVTLISLHILHGGTLDELLDALHPDPQSASKEQLAKIVERLQKESRRLATGMRGGDLRTGRKAAPLSAFEHGYAVYIQRRRREGATDEQILNEIGETPPGVPSLTMEELERLGGLKLD